ncbi:hypothetical protein JTT00_12940 [Clostridium botulinum]|nr:hypothetical protein [Clostridium botulinum]
MSKFDRFKYTEYNSNVALARRRFYGGKLKKKIKEHFSNGPKAILIVVVILMIASIVITNMRKTIIVSIDGKESQKITTFKKHMQKP